MTAMLNMQHRRGTIDEQRSHCWLHVPSKWRELPRNDLSKLSTFFNRLDFWTSRAVTLVCSSNDSILRKMWSASFSTKSMSLLKTVLLEIFMVSWTSSSESP